MSNPVFNRDVAFQRAPQAGGYGQQAGYADPYAPQGYAPQGYGQAGYGDPRLAPQAPLQQPQGLMTIEDVITKSGTILGALFLVAAATFLFLPIRLASIAMIVTGLVSFVTVLVVSLRRRINPAAVMAYAVLEGVFVGAFSKVFEMIYPGIVVSAILGTFLAAGATLAAYRFGNVRVSGRLRKIVTIGTMALAGLYLVNLLLSLAGIPLGLFQAGPLGFVISAVAIFLAVSNLLMDFEQIEWGIRNQAPASESWRAAFGLAVTMVWLYTEILRVMSYFRD